MIITGKELKEMNKEDISSNEFDQMNGSPSSWWRKLCEVSDRVYVSGDLHHDEEISRKQLRGWVDEGISHIFDCRQEWSDEETVKRNAPGIKYCHIGTHDDGGVQQLGWFEHGTGLMEEALTNPETKILIHCHMGVNRAPSMAFASLLRSGKGITESLNAIRCARPIAAIMYAESAVAWHGLRQNWSPERIENALCEVRDWQIQNPIDIRWVISRIRLKEQEVV